MLKNRKRRPEIELKTFKSFPSRLEGKAARVQYKPIRKKAGKK